MEATTVGGRGLRAAKLVEAEARVEAAHRVEVAPRLEVAMAGAWGANQVATMEQPMHGLHPHLQAPRPPCQISLQKIQQR